MIRRRSNVIGRVLILMIFIERFKSLTHPTNKIQQNIVKKNWMQRKQNKSSFTWRKDMVASVESLDWLWIRLENRQKAAKKPKSAISHTFRLKEIRLFLPMMDRKWSSIKPYGIELKIFLWHQVNLLQIKLNYFSMIFGSSLKNNEYFRVLDDLIILLIIGSCNWNLSLSLPLSATMAWSFWNKSNYH